VVLDEAISQDLTEPEPLGPRPTRSFPELTDREYETLELVADGHDNASIARLMYTSPKTARNRVSMIMAKVHAKDRAELIVRALTPLEKAGKPIFLTERLETVGAPGEVFMRVPLMSHVPHDAIVRSIEDCVQRDRQLDHPKSGADVTAGARTYLDESGPQLFRYGAQLVARHRLEVRGRMNSV